MPRKNPYSGKQKKQQLKEKKVRKQDGPRYLADWSDDDDDENDKPSIDKGKEAQQSDVGGAMGRTNKRSDLNLGDSDIQKINVQPESKPKSSINNFLLHFRKEPDDVIEKRKKKARRAFKRLPENDLEYSLQDVYPSHSHLDFPKRPTWSYSLSKEELERQENQYFKNYLSELVSQPDAEHLSYFELNLENWRQLWRVLEMSDILLVITDIRYPVLHISPSLLRYIREKLHKPVIIVLNKIDFVPPVLAVAWKRYIQTQFPGIYVVFFSSFVKKCTDEEDDLPLDYDTSIAMFRKPPKGSTSSLGPTQLYKAVLDIVKDEVDLSSWKDHLEEEGLMAPSAVSDSDVLSQLPSDVVDGAGDVGKEPEERYKDGVVTIGCIGYPNVGKSSVLNALKGKKVVSVSQTPGHTKHLQTIFLSPTVKLCDCPGLVFPSVVPKALQIVAGIFPVAQVREPYSVVQYLAERMNLPALLKIHPPDGEKDEEYKWSAYDICEAWAIKCGFLTSKAARPDIYRAANKILRLAVEGQLRLCFRPPLYSQNLDEMKSHAESLALHSLLKVGTKAGHGKHHRLEGKNNDYEDDVEDDDDSDDENGSDNIN